MLNNLFWKTLRDQRWSLLGWSLGLAALSLYLLYVYPFINRAASMMKVLDSLPPVIKNLIGKNNFMATPEGFFNLQPFSILAPLLFIVFAVAKGSDATAGEEERGTLDLLLANPLRRRQVVLHKSLAHGAASFLLSVVFWLGMAGRHVAFRHRPEPAAAGRGDLQLLAAGTGLFMRWPWPAAAGAAKRNSASASAAAWPWSPI